MNDYRVCQRCVMDSTVPGVVFYNDGTCSYCREYARRQQAMARWKAKNSDALSSLVSRIKHDGKGRKYDALIGLSGGLDSSYAAYVAVKHGLRVLGLHVDNGWDTPLAIENIRCLARSLGIDIIVEAPSWEHFRDLQLAFLRASVRNAEIPTDHVITATLYRVASRHHIRYIITGANFATEGVALPEAFGYYNQDLRYLRSIHRRFGEMPLKGVPTLGIPRRLYYRYIQGIRLVRILDFVDYWQQEAEAILTRETRWKPYEGKHNESVYTRFYQSYILPRKFGLDKRRLHLSALVCSGQLSREEALKALKEPHYRDAEMLASDMEEVLRKLRLSKEEFELIMQAPARSDKEFPSNRWLFELARKLARRGIRLYE